MTEQQLPALMGALVTHQRAFLALPNSDAQWAQENTKAAIGLMVESIKNRGQTSSAAEQVRADTPSILELVSTIVVNASTDKFVAKEKFVINTKRNAPVKISYLGNDFEAWFLSGDGKTEDPTCLPEGRSQQTLRYHKLRQSSVDGPVIAELGGAEKSETTLSAMFSLMEKQEHGENGVLLNNGYTNIFYIKDNAGVLRSVDVDWHGGGWRVSASSVGGPNRWDGGHQVFSRNPV